MLLFSQSHFIKTCDTHLHVQDLETIMSLELAAHLKPTADVDCFF